MKNTKHIPRIIIFLFLLVHVPLRAVPDPLELQQVAEKIRQSVLGDRTNPAVAIERAVWDIADGMSVDGLKSLFPEKCRDFHVNGSFKVPGVYIVCTRFTYACFSFLCVFLQLINILRSKGLFYFRKARIPRRFCGS